jgi:hypothetical protein
MVGWIFVLMRFRTKNQTDRYPTLGGTAPGADAASRKQERCAIAPALAFLRSDF